MKSPTLRGGLRAALACLAIGAAAPASASASTWTVDDDKAQCPNASFTSIQAAVNQAAPWDTVLVCDGLYQEQSTPLTHAQSPAVANSKNGLTITKPLTIKGTGASKVTIQPAAALTTLAGDTPQLRDGGGNVVTISRQSLGSSDMTENFVDISGVTISSPNTYAEAGVAFFNTSGRIANSTIGPLKRVTQAADLAASPLGYGLVMTNHLLGSSEGTVRREVTLENSLVTGYQTGGVLFDGATTAAPATRSGINQYGYVTGSRIVGAGAQALHPQNGVEYHSGARGFTTRSEIANNRYSTDLRQSVGFLLTDAETGADPLAGTPNASLTASNVSGNGYGAFNANAANSAVRENAPVTVGGPGAAANYWGCAGGPLVGSPSSFSGGTNGCQGLSGPDATPNPTVAGIGAGEVLAAGRTALSVPAATTDARPTGAVLSGDLTVPVGGSFEAVAEAADDFGVKRVALLLDGTAIQTKTSAPYEFAPTWSPTEQDAGRTFALAVQVTDSSGQTTTSAPTTLTVAGPKFEKLIADAATQALGEVTVGASTQRAATFANQGPTAIKLSAVDLTGAGFSRTGGTCAVDLVVPPGQACTVVVAFTPAVSGASTGTLSVDTAANDEPATVTLTGTGVLPPAVVDAPAPPAPPAPPVPPAPPAPLPPTPGGSSTSTVVKSVGGLTATVSKKLSASLKTGSMHLGRLKCATGAACTVEIAGVLKIGKQRYAIEVTRTLRSGATSAVTLRLTRAARTALKKAKTGTLVVTFGVGADVVGATLTLTGK